MKKTLHPSEPLWICGFHPVAATLDVGRPAAKELVYSRRGERMQALLELAVRRRVPVRLSDWETLTQLSGSTHHQGVALHVAGFPYADLETALTPSSPLIDPLVVLDCIQDPQNLGAILRSACFFGAAGAILPRHRSAPVTATVIKVAAGATAFLPIYQETNMVRTLERLQAAGLWTIGLALEGTRSLYDLDLTTPLALVVGNEQQGLRRLVRTRCDLLARIPGHGPIESLNAANAAAAALAEIQRQRMAA